MQWNRLPTSKQEQYIKEGIKAAGRAVKIKMDSGRKRMVQRLRQRRQLIYIGWM